MVGRGNQVAPDEIQAAGHSNGDLGGRGAASAKPGEDRGVAPMSVNTMNNRDKDPLSDSNGLASHGVAKERVQMLSQFETSVTNIHNNAQKEADTGCLMPNARFIFNPYSGPRLAWDMWIVVLLIYTSMMVPYALAFSDVVCDETDIAVGDVVLLWLIDCCFWLDILLNFRTAILDPKDENLVSMTLTSDWRVITRQYLKGWFWLDVIGSFPVQVVEKAIMNDQCSLAALKALRLNRLARLARLLKLIRLARLARWGRLITKAKDALSINPGHLRLVQFMLLVFVLAHFLSCMLYGLTDWQDGYAINWATEVTIVVPGEGLFSLKCPQPKTNPIDDSILAADSPTRFAEVMRGGHLRQVPECIQDADGPNPYWLLEAEPPVKYLVSLYVTFTTLTTVGYGDITMKTTPELVLAIVMMAVGASTFAVVIGNMAALLGKMDTRFSAYKERMEDLDDFMHQENLPLDLRYRTRNFFEYRYNHSRDIPASIEELSLSLRSEVALHLYNDLITTVPFFRDCGKEFLTEIILRLKAQTLSPTDYLYEAGEYGDSMYFLIKGSVEVILDEQHGVFAELPEGSFFGEHCVLGLADHRPVSVRAMTWCNLFCLTQHALEECIYHHPEAQEHFRKLAYEQSAEKTVSSAVASLDAERRPSLEGYLREATPPEAEASENFRIEPPVVTRALMRARKGQAPGKGAGSPGVNLGTHAFAQRSPGVKSSVDLGTRIAGDKSGLAQLSAERFAREVMSNVAAAQRQSHSMRMQLRADLEKLYSQLQRVSKEDS